MENWGHSFDQVISFESNWTSAIFLILDWTCVKENFSLNEYFNWILNYCLIIEPTQGWKGNSRIEGCLKPGISHWDHYSTLNQEFHLNYVSCHDFNSFTIYSYLESSNMTNFQESLLIPWVICFVLTIIIF